MSSLYRALGLISRTTKTGVVADCYNPSYLDSSGKTESEASLVYNEFQVSLDQSERNSKWL